MSRRPSKAWLWLLLPVSAAAFFVSANLIFYRGSYDPPSTPVVAFDQIGLPALEVIRSRETPVRRHGLLVVDNAHRNDFDEKEVTTLISKVTDRGFEVEFILGRGATFSFAGERLALLEELLREADSLAVLVPRIPYSTDELEVVQRFVEKGGRLLLIGDPSRPSDIDSIGDRFGILFQAGYLYNVVDHDLNFRNIFVSEFLPDRVTDGLTTIALYTAGSIRSSGVPLALADTNTFSSMVERVEPFTPMVKGGDGRVLAISDFTFMEPPQNSTLDNDRLISNIADFLATGERSFDVSDFPHFFGGDVDILLGRADLFDTGTRLKSLLSASQISSEMKGVEDLTKDTVFLGLYQDSPAVGQYLASARVQVSDTLRTPFTPDIAIAGTALVLLNEGPERSVLVVLSDTEFGLSLTVDLLDLGAFRDGLVSDHLGVYRLQ